MGISGALSVRVLVREPDNIYDHRDGWLILGSICGITIFRLVRLGEWEAYDASCETLFADVACRY